MTDPIQRLHELAAKRFADNKDATGWESQSMTRGSTKDYLKEAWEELADAVNYVSMDCGWETDGSWASEFMRHMRGAVRCLHEMESAKDD